MNQFNLTSTIHLHELKDDELSEIEYFPSFIQNAMKFDDWIILQDFQVDSKGNCYSLSHKAATKKEMTLIRIIGVITKLKIVARTGLFLT